MSTSNPLPPRRHGGMVLAADVDALSAALSDLRTVTLGQGINGTGSRHPQLNAALAAAVGDGYTELRLAAGTYDLSGGDVFVPAGLTLRGVGGATILTGGPHAIYNDGAVADLTIGGGWSLYGPFSNAPTGASGAAIIGGTVTRVGTQRPGRQAWPTREAHNRLPRTTARLANNSVNRPVNVAILSDSLGASGSGTGVGWADLLFNNAYSAAEGANYYVGNVFGGSDVNLTNLAIPGSTAAIDQAFIAWEQAGSTGDGLDGQVLAAPGFGSGPNTLAGMDLAFICQGHNGGETETIETLAMWLRKNGVEVIILTQNPTGGNDPAFAANLWRLRRIAASTGAVVADTYSAFLREVAFGRATFAGLLADGTHPVQAGWNIYAQTILDVLRDQTESAPSAPQLPTQRVLRGNLSSYSPERWGNLTCMTAAPAAKSGGAVTVTPANTAVTPLFGRRADFANTAVDLPVGQWAEFAVIDGFDVTIILEQKASATTATVTTDAGATTIVGGITTVAAPTSPLPQVYNIDSGTWGTAIADGNHPWGRLPFRSRPLRITSTAGTVRVLAVAYSTLGKRIQPRNPDGTFRGVTLTGTWGTEAGPWYGISNVPYTDADNASMTFDFVGDGVMVKVARSKAAGRLYGTLDGVAGYFGEGGFWNTATDSILPLVATGLAYGRHRLTLAVRDTYPGNGVAPVVGQRGMHKLAVYEIATLDSRMNALDSELLRPADVI